jgi:hypothetical protein
MLFVLLSHFLEAFFPNPDWFDVLLGDIADAASPTFVLISGLLIGFLYRTRPDAFPRLRTKLIDRGLFLLTIGHLLLLGGHFAMRPTVRWIPITDAVGFSMLVSPWFVTRFSRAQRALTSAALFGLSWLIVALWHPHAGAEALKETFFGSQPLRFYTYAFPLVPWFCVDLAATAIGDSLGEFHIRRNFTALTSLLDRLWVGSILAAITIAVGLKGLSMVWPVNDTHLADAAYGMRALHQRIPPGPVHLLFYGGLGLLLLRLTFAAEQNTQKHLKAFIAYASTIGQCSLFVFVWQMYVYYTGVYFIHTYLPFPWAWPVYFVATALMVLVPAFWWQRAGYNRFITVGYPKLVRAHEGRADVQVQDRYGMHRASE